MGAKTILHFSHCGILSHPRKPLWPLHLRIFGLAGPAEHGLLTRGHANADPARFGPGAWPLYGATMTKKTKAKRAERTERAEPLRLPKSILERMSREGIYELEEDGTYVDQAGNRFAPSTQGGAVSSHLDNLLERVRPEDRHEAKAAYEEIERQKETLKKLLARTCGCVYRTHFKGCGEHRGQRIGS